MLHHRCRKAAVGVHRVHGRRVAAASSSHQRRLLLVMELACPPPPRRANPPRSRWIQYVRPSTRVDRRICSLRRIGLCHSCRPWSGSDSHVKVKVKGSRQGQEIPFTQSKIKDRSETLTRNTGPQNLLRVTANTTCTGRALTQVVTAVLVESFGQSEIYSARSVTSCYQAVSNRPICIQSLPRRQLAQLPTKMSYYSSILPHIYIYTYTSTYELARLLIVAEK